ncbi:transmembrane protein, putative (macronuclear) [Tetrahymena thermophila SB210]|uniref:Transmembrane protein, putative n=1 Tax=Tetrahymena thermophila (strain SB210) TaxID=312017 RepID=I7M151_TETTS|nr:transmembrane protein, putative [Tetrahymena thermophila SB210]EAR94941.1 transmembrane protein, putative [Tetrahymena thermophila SB210]|eukprot:XP_001015186.1 transmembrane protein, putative [Tetrahymena thermophila SB210]
MNSTYLLIFCLLAVSINGQMFFSLNLNKTYYPFAQTLNAGQNTTNLCYFTSMVTLTPIQVPNQNQNFTGFQVSGSINKNVTNCVVPSVLNFVKSSTDLTPLVVDNSSNNTDFNNIYVVDNINKTHIYKFINQINNAQSANANLYVYHNDTGLDNYVQQVLKLIAISSSSSLVFTLVFGLFALIY